MEYAICIAYDGSEIYYYTWFNEYDLYQSYLSDLNSFHTDKLVII